MPFGISGSSVNAMVSRTVANQYGSVRSRTKICPLGPGCSPSDMPQNCPVASSAMGRGGGASASGLSSQPANAATTTIRKARLRIARPYTDRRVNSATAPTSGTAIHASNAATSDARDNPVCPASPAKPANVLTPSVPAKLSSR